MKRIFLHIVFVIALSLNLIAQYNYVPNPSFEQLDSCPKIEGQLTNSCNYWFNPTAVMVSQPPLAYCIPDGSGSSDYFNQCGLPHWSIPKNNLGFQNPMTGVAYCGILALLNDTLYQYYYQYREYIEIKLNKKLKANFTYCAEFYYSMTGVGAGSPPTRYDMVELGMLFTDTIVRRASGIGTGQPQNIYTTPQVSAMMGPSIDTVNWIKVSGTFIANGGEEYLTIGNFKELDTLFGDVWTYIYIDDVSVYYCGPDTNLIPIDSLIIPNVFTPNGDGYNDKFKYKNQEQWEFETQVFNRWGDLVFDNNNSENWDGTFKGNKVTAGVYFYIIKAQAIKTGEMTIQKGHVTVMY